jgi:phospholipase/carboxylesterase
VSAPLASLGPLAVREAVIGGPGASPPAEPLTVVLLHGFGAPGDDLAGLAEPLAACGLPAGTRLVFPEAPIALSSVRGFELYEQARAWWLVDFGRRDRLLRSGGVSAAMADEPEGIADARAQVEAMLDALAARGVRPERTVLGGFSQGAMLSAEVAFRGESARRLAGLVLLSGAFVAADAWRTGMPARAGLPVFQRHGRVDEVLPILVARPLAEAMQQAGLDVDWGEFDGGHGIPPEALRDLGAWLARR